MVRVVSRTYSSSVLRADRLRFRAMAPYRRPRPPIEPPPDIVEAREWGIEELLIALVQVSEVISDGRTIEHGRALVESARADDPLLDASWDDLIRANLVRTIGPRFFVAGRPHREPEDPRRLPIYRVLQKLYARALGQQVRTAMAADVVARHRERFPDAPQVPELIARGMLEDSEHGLRLRSECPDLPYFAPSVLARVWERTAVGPPSPIERLWWWQRRASIPSQRIYEDVLGHLAKPDRRRFIDAVWAVVKGEPDFSGWSAEEARIRARHAIERGDLDPDHDGPQDPGEPATLLQRLAWINRPSYLDEPHWGRGFLLGLVRGIVLDEESRLGDGGTWTALLDALELAMDRPVIFDMVQFVLSERVESCADVLLEGRWAALGLVIAANISGFLPLVGDVTVEDQDELGRHINYWSESIRLGLAGWRNVREGEGDFASDIAEVLLWLYERRDPPQYGPFSGRLRRWPQIRAAMFTEALADEGVAEWVRTHGDQIVERLQAALSKAAEPPTSGAFCALAWLVASPVASSAQRETGARALIDSYEASVQSDRRLIEDLFDNAVPWLDLAQVLVRDHDPLWKRLLAVPAMRGLDVRSDSHRKRTHLRVIASLVTQWSKRPGEAPAPASLEAAFLDALRDGLPTTFDPDVDVRFYSWTRLQESLAVTVAHAVNALASQTRVSAIDAIVSAPLDARTLGQLSTELTRADDRQRILDRLRTLPAFDKNRRQTLAELRETVDAFIETDRVDAAESLLARVAVDAEKRLGPTWFYKTKLRLALEREQWDVLAEAVPKKLRGDPEARKLRDFYEALACISRKPPQLEKARDLFQALHEREPTNAAHALNLFSTIVQLAAGPQPDDDEQKRRARILEALAFGKTTVEPLRPLGPTTERIYQDVRLGALGEIGDWNQLLSEHAMLPRELQGRLGHLAVIALAQVGSEKQARAMLDDLRDVLGASIVADVERKLAAVDRSRLSMLSDAVQRFVEDPVVRIREALRALPSLPPEAQARAWSREGQEISVEGFVIDHVVEALTEIAQLAPNLAFGDQVPEENRLNELLITILDQRVLHLGWFVTGQCRRGHTKRPAQFGRGGIGEADVEVHGTERRLSIGEALVLSGKDTTRTTEHLNKVFAYGLPDLAVSFVLVWMVGDATKVWEDFCDVSSEHDVPGFPATAREPVPEIELRGIRAMAVDHTIEAGRAHRVYHFGVDLAQLQRRAAVGQPEAAPASQSG